MELSQACAETTNLLIEHGLLAKGWSFKLARGKNLLGSCYFKDKTIRISRHHIQSGTDAEVRDTIRHEIAHALVGPGKGHGYEWRAMASRLGAIPRPRRRVSYDIPYKYHLVCEHCNTVCQRRHRGMSKKRLDQRWHKRCGPAAMGKLRIVEVSRVAV